MANFQPRDVVIYFLDGAGDRTGRIVEILENGTGENSLYSIMDADDSEMYEVHETDIIEVVEGPTVTQEFIASVRNPEVRAEVQRAVGIAEIQREPPSTPLDTWGYIDHFGRPNSFETQRQEPLPYNTQPIRRNVPEQHIPEPVPLRTIEHLRHTLFTPGANRPTPRHVHYTPNIHSEEYGGFMLQDGRMLTPIRINEYGHIPYHHFVTDMQEHTMWVNEAQYPEIAHFNPTIVCSDGFNLRWTTWDVYLSSTGRSSLTFGKKKKKLRRTRELPIIKEENYYSDGTMYIA